MTKNCILLALVLSLALSLNAARRALVIGNSAYESAALINPANDALDVSSALTRMGFQVSKHTDLSYAAFDQAVREFSAKVAPGDEVIFFYAGHGVEVDGSNYLLPVRPRIESEVDCREYAINASWVMGRLESAEMLVFILDACRDNPFKGTRSSSRGLASMSTKAGSTVLVYATEPGKVASDGSGKRNSPFTQALLNNLDNSGTIDDMLIETSRDLLALTKGDQRMWRAGSLNDYYSLSQGKLETKRDMEPRSAEADTLYYETKVISHKVFDDGMKHGDLYVSFTYPIFTQERPEAGILNGKIRKSLLSMLREYFPEIKHDFGDRDLAEIATSVVKEWDNSMEDNDYHHSGMFLEVGLEVKLNGKIVTLGGYFDVYKGGATHHPTPLYYSYDLVGNELHRESLIPQSNRAIFENKLVSYYRDEFRNKSYVSDELILNPYGMYLVRDGLLVIEIGDVYWDWDYLTIPKSDIYYLLSEDIRKLY